MTSVPPALRRLALAAMALAAVSCNTKSNPPAPDAGAEEVISIRGNSSQMGDKAFSPGTDTVYVGTKVAWKNNDTMAHTSTRKESPLPWDTGNIAPGSKSAPIAMTLAGTYTYSCSIMMHKMSGVLVVRERTP